MGRYFFFAVLLLFVASVRAEPMPSASSLMQIVHDASDDFSSCEVDSCKQRVITRYFGPATRKYVEGGPAAKQDRATAIMHNIAKQLKRGSEASGEWGPWTVINKLGEELPVQLSSERYDRANISRINFVNDPEYGWRIEVIKPSQLKRMSPTLAVPSK